MLINRKEKGRGIKTLCRKQKIFNVIGSVSRPLYVLFKEFESNSNKCDLVLYFGLLKILFMMYLEVFLLERCN